MATREQIAQALQAAHAAGNVEHARILAQAYRDLGDKQAITQPSTAAYSEFDKLPLGEKLLVGTGKGAADAITGITDLLGYSDTFNLGNHAEQDKIISESTPGKIGEVAGNVAATLPTIFMPGANTLKGAALIGGGAGYLTNKGDHHERVDNALVGAAGGLLGASLPYGYNLAEKIFAPLGSRKSKEKIIGSVINNAAQDSAPGIEQRLLGYDELIPGSAPTAAEVAESGGIAALQRAMSSANPEAYTNRALEQSSARVNALRGIAQDETALQSAIKQREIETSGLYDQVHNTFVQSNPALERILSTPAGQKAVADARILAGNEYRQFGESIPSPMSPDVKTFTGKQEGIIPAQHWTKTPIDEGKHNILTAIRKLGGINKDMAQENYGNEMWKDIIHKGLFRNEGGQSLDDLAARLSEMGYLPEGATPYDVVDVLYSASAPQKFSVAKQNYDDVFEPEITESGALNDQIKRLADVLEKKNAPKQKIDAVEKSPFDTGYYGRDLHNIQRSLTAAVTDKNTDNVLRRSIGNVLGDYKKTLEENIHGLLDVNLKYAELSKPINQMEVGQELLNRLQPALSDYGALGKETAATYAKALKDVNGNLVKKATGGISKGIDDVMTPEQMGILNNIAKDLARKSNAQDLGRGVGSNTFQNFAMNGIAEAAGIPSAVSGLLQLIPPTRYAMNVGKAASSKLYEGAEKEMKAMMADALLDPKETARLMQLARQRGLLSGPRVDALPGLLGIGLANSLQ
jgi:hypothetical protein